MGVNLSKHEDVTNWFNTSQQAGNRNLNKRSNKYTFPNGYRLFKTKKGFFFWEKGGEVSEMVDHVWFIYNDANRHAKGTFK